MIKDKDWYIVENIDAIDSPALLVYPERVEYNIRLMVDMVGSVEKLRPHVKTYKMPEIVQMQQKNGIHKFKCATISEAEMLGNAGVKDVLLAYQPIGPKIGRLLSLAQMFPDTEFSTIIDNPETAGSMAGQFAMAGSQIEVLIDLNVGMDRTGIKPGEGAIELMKFCHRLRGLDLKGFHVYDGHIRDKDLNVRQRRCDEAFFPVLDLKAKYLEIFDREPLIVAGGSPTFPIHAHRAEVECSPGTSLLWDWGYQHMFPDMTFKIAALVITRVISIIDKDTICLDLGHKAIAAENPLPRVHFLNAPDVNPVGQSEEHLVAKVPESAKYKPGQVFYGIPVHICPTVALYQEANIVRKNQVVNSWKIVSRDRKITI